MKVQEIGAFEAKTRLSELLDQVARGHEFLITKRGQPVARLIGKEHQPAPRLKKPKAWKLYQQIQKSGRKLAPRQLDNLVSESRRELTKRTEGRQG